MKTLLSLLAVAVTAALGENVFFIKALGDGGLSYQRYTPSEALYHSLWTTAAALLAAFSGWLGKYLSDKYLSLQKSYQPVVYLAVYSVLFIIFCIVGDKLKLLPDGLRRNIRAIVFFGYIPLATMTTVAFGVYTLPQSLAYGLGVAVGYLVAVELIFVVRARIAFSPVPRPFQGLPISLIYIGLVSLALFGLLGHQPVI